MRQKLPHLALALAALVSLPLAAAEATEKATPKPDAPAAGSAMKIHVDPATGQIVPKPVVPEAKALAAAPPESLPVLKVEAGRTKAGGKRVRLDGRFMMEMVATVQPDGSVTHSCDAKHEKAPAAAEVRRER